MWFGNKQKESGDVVMGESRKLRSLFYYTNKEIIDKQFLFATLKRGRVMLDGDEIPYEGEVEQYSPSREFVKIISPNFCSSRFDTSKGKYVGGEWKRSSDIYVLEILEYNNAN